MIVELVWQMGWLKLNILRQSTDIRPDQIQFDVFQSFSDSLLGDMALKVGRNIGRQALRMSL
jgi:hypothetical protein